MIVNSKPNHWLKTVPLITKKSREQRSNLYNLETVISAIIITYNEKVEEIEKAIKSLLNQDYSPEEIILVDNSKDLKFKNITGVKYISSGKNLGFAAGVNLAAKQAAGDYIFLFNPDAKANKDALLLLKGALDKNKNAVVAGGQIILPDERVNAGDNPIHLTGLSWAGNYLGKKESGPERATLAVSGAAILIRKDYFLKSGLFHPALFMYFDDSDLGWRANLQGKAVLFVPRAEVIHNYDFNKGLSKWQFLEEGRLISLLTNYQRKTLLLLSPALIMTELAIVLFSLRSGWFKYKLKAYLTLIKKRKLIIKTRHLVQKERSIDDKDLIYMFETSLNSPILNQSVLKMTAPIFKLYKKIIQIF